MIGTVTLLRRFRIVRISWLLLFVSALAQSQPQACADAPLISASQEGKVRAVPGEIVVMFDSEDLGPTPGDKNIALVRKLGLELFDYPFEFVEGSKTAIGEFVFRLPKEVVARQPDPEMEVEMLERIRGAVKPQRDIRYAHPNYLFNRNQTPPKPSPNDPCFPLQWNLRPADASPNSKGTINFHSAWIRHRNEKLAEITVAVLDTGLVHDNPDIQRIRIKRGYRFARFDGRGIRIADSTDNGNGTNYHGTHVAGILGAAGTNNGTGITGIAANVNVQPVRVLGPVGGAYTDIIDGLHWAAGLAVPSVPNEDKNSFPARIINLSFGIARRCSELPGLRKTVDRIIGSGVLIVASAGNEAKDAMEFSPGGCNGVITVAASDRYGNLAPYSNYGKAITLMAPGGYVDDIRKNKADAILSTYGNGYAFMQGTSMASPHVAGVLALIWGRNPKSSAEDVTKRLISNATASNAEKCSKPCGAGLLNADVK